VPIADGAFQAGERHLVFESDGFRVATPDGDTAYERVPPMHPSAPELAAFTGTYSSPETDASLTIAATEGELTLTIGSGSPVRFRPTFRDAFMMQATAIRFLRDESGNVTGLSAGDDRAWDLRFTKVH